MDDTLSVLKVHDVVLVTMPANPDDETVAALQDRTLQSLEKHIAHGVVLDLSAVDSLDSFLARTVVETARMIGLMGGVTVIAGMRPSVAITATELGFSLGTVRTALDVDGALDMVAATLPLGRRAR